MKDSPKTSAKLSDGPSVKDGKYLDNEGLTEHEKFLAICRAMVTSGAKMTALAVVMGNTEQVTSESIREFVDDSIVYITVAGLMPNIVEKNPALIN